MKLEKISDENMNIGIIVSEFNKEITKKMENAAEAHVTKLGHTVVEKFYVFGALDVAIPLQHLLKKKTVDAVVILGAVVSGETDHDKVVVDGALKAFIDLQIKYEKPIGWGISGPRQTWEQADARAEEYAQRAVEAVVKIKEQI